MLEHIPAWLGSLLRNVRAGHSKLAIVERSQGLANAIDLSSPAFANGARLPARFTADGEGISPPLTWSQVPAGAVSLALIVEDPDAPMPHPLVHALSWDLPANMNSLPEGALQPSLDRPAAYHIGRNSYLTSGWLPPDPPSGHGTHDYVFQLFALSEPLGLEEGAGRADFLEALSGRVMAAGMHVGTYSREEPSTTFSGAESAAIPQA